MLGGWCAGRRRFLWSLESNRKQKKLIHKGFQSLRGKRAFFRALNATNTSFSASISFTKLSGKTPCLPPNSPIHQPASAQSWMTQVQMLEEFAQRGRQSHGSTLPTLVMMLMISPSFRVSSSSFWASYGKSTLHCSRPDTQDDHSHEQTCRAKATTGTVEWTLVKACSSPKTKPNQICQTQKETVRMRLKTTPAKRMMLSCT